HAQDAVSLLDSLRTVLPILAALAVALAVGLSGDRRRTILGLSLVLAVVFALMVVMIGLARNAYLDALPSTVNRDAAAAVYDQVLHLLSTSLRAGIAFVAVVATAAWLAGPVPFARRARDRVRGRLRRDGETDPGARSHVGSWVRPLQVSSVAAGLLV